jgi:hypothetical protein
LKGNQLPSNHEMLRYFFYLLKVPKIPSKRCAETVAISVVELWKTAHIPTKRMDKVVEKISKMYKRYANLKKSLNKEVKSTDWRQQVSAFTACFNELFDIAPSNVMILLTDESVKQFRINQRKPGREGRISYTRKSKVADNVLKGNNLE